MLVNTSPVREAEIARSGGEIFFPIVSMTRTSVEYGKVSSCPVAAAIFLICVNLSLQENSSRIGIFSFEECSADLL